MKDFTTATKPAWQWTTHDEDQTWELGRSLGAACRGGEVILLEGPLGAGKTCLAGGIAAGLGIDEPTPSPTFAILRTYRGGRGLTLHHVDCYRLNGADDLATVGLDECFAPDAVLLVEWASRCAEAFDGWTLCLRIEPDADENSRLIRAWSGHGAFDFDPARR